MRLKLHDGVRRWCVCIYCGDKLELSIRGAKLMGWKLHYGGSECCLCLEKKRIRRERKRWEVKIR